MSVFGPNGIHGVLQFLYSVPAYGGFCVKQANLLRGFLLRDQIVGGDGESTDGSMVGPASRYAFRVLSIIRLN